MFGFIGPNGAGKTTLIRTMLDLIRASEGEIQVFGLDSRRGAREIHARTGYVPGELGLWEKLTARQVLYLAGLRGGRGSDRIEGLAERLRLSLDRPIRELSKGNKEKVGLIQALMHEPDLLVLDEPTGGLDPLIQHEVFAIIDQAQARGATVFFSSHYLSEVERIAHRVGIVREGRLAADDTVEGLKRRAKRRIEATLREQVDPAEFERIEGVSAVQVSDRRLSLAVSGSMDAVVKALRGSPDRNAVDTRAPISRRSSSVFTKAMGTKPSARAQRQRMLRSVAGRGIFEQRRAVIGWALGLAALVVIVFLYYPSIRDDAAITSFYENLPDVAKALSGVIGVDIASPAGYLSSQLFANMVPIIFIIYGVILGSAAIGREEDRKTAELLFSAPVSRRRVVAEKALSGTILLDAARRRPVRRAGGGPRTGRYGDLLRQASRRVDRFGPDRDDVRRGRARGQLRAGAPRASGAGAGGLAFASFLIYSLAPVVASLQDWQKASPFYWYLHSNPLASGFVLGDLGVLAAMSVVPAVIAAELFDRRDISS